MQHIRISSALLHNYQKYSSLEQPPLIGSLFCRSEIQTWQDYFFCSRSLWTKSQHPWVGKVRNLLQHSYLENSIDRGAFGAIVMGSQRVRHDWVTNFHFILKGTNLFLKKEIQSMWDIQHERLSTAGFEDGRVHPHSLECRLSKAPVYSQQKRNEPFFLQL